MHTDVRRLSVSRAKPNNRYEKGAQLSGVIYIHRISDNRFGGIAGRNFRTFRELCGDTTLKNVVLVTNMWRAVSREVGKTRENELSREFFKPAIEAGAQIVHHSDTAKSARKIIGRIVKNHPVVLQIQRELVDEKKNIVDTAAGGAVNRELDEQIKRHRAELKELQEEMQALKEKDEQARQELRSQARTLQEQMEKMKKDSEEMASNYAVEKKRMEAMIKEIEQEREQAEADRARWKDLIGNSGPPTRETGWVGHPQYQAPWTPSPPPRPQTPSRPTPCVRVLFYLATHND